MEIGILVSHPERKSLLAKSAGADFVALPLFLPFCLTALSTKVKVRRSDIRFSRVRFTHHTKVPPMKLTPKPILSLILVLGPAFIFSAYSSHAETVRKPVRAGSFYPSVPSELRTIITQLTVKAQNTRLQIPRNKHLRAIVLPHAGYIYSGWTAAHASRVLHLDQFTKVILLGPDHYIGFSNGAICDAAAYETPLGKIKLHENTAKLRLQPELFQSLPVIPGQRTFFGSHPAFSADLSWKISTGTDYRRPGGYKRPFQCPGWHSRQRHPDGDQLRSFALSFLCRSGKPGPGNHQRNHEAEPG